MFKRKKTGTGDNNAPEQKEAPQKKRHPIKFALKLVFTLLFLVIIAGCGAIWWACQTQSGQNWLLTTINKALAPAADSGKMYFRLTHLTGSLPFDLECGIEGYDSKGLWLKAPQNKFLFLWRELPGSLHIASLKSSNANVERLPEIPPSNEPEKPAQPMTMAQFRDLLRQAAQFLTEKHWWLPDIKLENIGLENALLPAGLVPYNKSERLCLNSDLHLFFHNNTTDFKATVHAANQGGAPVTLPSFNFTGLNADLTVSGKPMPSGQGLDAQSAVAVKIDSPKLQMPDMPENMLGDQINLNLDLQAQAITEAANLGAALKLAGPNLDAGLITLRSDARWHSGEGWQHDRVDGETAMNLALKIVPADSQWLQSHAEAPLAMLKSPATLNFKTSGDLPKMDLQLNLSCGEVEAAGHVINDISLLLKSVGIELPMDSDAMAALRKEHHCSLDLGARMDNSPVKLHSLLYFQNLDAQTINGAQHQTWRAGLRDLDLSALGLTAKGAVAALLAADEKPLIDGKISLDIQHWQDAQKFLPDYKLSGNVQANLTLASGKAGDPGKSLPENFHGDLSGHFPQNVSVNLRIPEFAMVPANGGDSIRLDRMNIDAELADVFGDLGIQAGINAHNIHAASMDIGAKIEANGKLSGPLTAKISTSGNVDSKIAATWSPGDAFLDACNVRLTLPAEMSPAKKPALLAIQSQGKAHFTYGDGGISVQNLDLRLTPSGRLQANGALSPEKLNFALKLENLDFKPWQSIVPQLPVGAANMSVNLNGTPARPGGNFHFNVTDVTIPGATIPPISLALNGEIQNTARGSALKTDLRLDPKTIKAFGGTQANVSATLPLKFAENGVPMPNMDGNLSAKVLWDGALGPLWNLLPMPDRRLNGRLQINIDASGNLKRPNIRGGININQGRFEDLLLGILLTDIKLKLNLTDKGFAKASQQGALDTLPGGMTLDMSLSDGRGGTVTINGGGALSGTDLDIQAKINRLRPLRRRDVHVELSGGAQVKGTATAPVITGEIIVNQGEVLLNNIAFGGSVTTLPISDGSNSDNTEKDDKKQSNNQPVTSPPPADTSKGSIHLAINMLPRFTVEGRGLTSIWKANLLVEGTPDNPLITGNISSVRGNFDFLGKNFALTKGIVFFGGGAVSNPLLDIELTNETPDLTAHLLITGPVSKIKLTMTSDPELPRDEILSRVLFGRSVGDLSRMEALQLAAAVAQLAGFGGGSGILGMAKKALGVDVLRLGTSSSEAAGEPGDQTAGGTTIEMGKYITDMIYMGVQQGMKPDSTAFIIQMELTPRSSLEVRTEQSNTWGGINWKYNY